MSTELKPFGEFMRQRLNTDLDTMVNSIRQAGPGYTRLDRSALRDSVAQLSAALIESLEQDNPSNLVIIARDISKSHSQNGFTITEVVQIANTLRDYTWMYLLQFMRSNETWHLAKVRYLEDRLHQLSNNIVAGFEETLRWAQDELASQSEQLEAQNRMISELSTPILPVHEGIIVLPLVGALDSRRATQIMENLLQAISDYQSDIVIIDITGVPMVDTSVANYLLQTARAANLVGARIILVGIGAEIAQTMVQLGVDLSRITTLANLQEGLQHAFLELGYSIT